jgi:hypothetical protein
MSRNVQATKKPYCKVCFDAGKPETEYSSHRTRTLPDRNGKTTVTCPTLLNTECRFCFKLGHTTKYCPAIEQNRKEKERADRKERAEAVEKSKPKVQEKKPSSSFAVLCCDSDSEDEEKVSKVKVIDNFPVLNIATKQAATEEPKQLSGWAAIAAKPLEAKVVPAQNDGLILLTKNIKYESKPKEEVKPTTAKPAPWANKEPVVTKTWADWSDSEDEYEDCQQYQPYSFAAAEEDDEDW